jgi:hypothetical protein
MAALCLVVSTLALTAETPASAARQKSPAQPAVSASIPPVVKDLPVRKVVLYKNGVGYFEHAGTVSGNQRVAIDFTSPQLNDVLQSLTVLDQGGGRIAGVNYNSTTPLAEQLKSLSLGMSDDPTSTELFGALRGQRVEVVGSPGGALTGRLMSIEPRTEKTGNGDGTVERFYLTLVTASGAVRVIELTSSLSVRPVDPGLESQLDRYLELLSATHSTGLRHLTLDALGQGQRELHVSYISEVPVWKSTYRIVFPRDAGLSATVQGWAVVDNTVGADWNNVQLALVAGSPQSFIQPLSQPLYTRRPEVAIATAVETTPQTHQAAEVALPRDVKQELRGQYAGMALGAPLQTSETVPVNADVPGSGAGGNAGGMYKIGGVYRPSDALQAGDVTSNAFDDFFEYALSQPVTIHKNESAMVPILQQELPAEHVTLWSPNERSALRAVWLENKSSLTLDSGSFSIFENGQFAGEGLLEPIHPGEKRLLSYAADQAVKVRRGGFGDTRTLHHIAMHDGVLVETTVQTSENTYTVTNGADEARTVIVEHPRNGDAELDSSTKPAESTAAAYRFRVAVDPHQFVELKVGERRNLAERVIINPDNDRSAFLVSVSRYTPELADKLHPLIDAETAYRELDNKLKDNEQRQKTLTNDEARARDNITALKGNDVARRFVDELNRAEDELDAARKEQASLQQQRDLARAHLSSVIASLSFDADLNVVTQSNQLAGATGSR